MSVSRKVIWPFGSFRCGSSCELMKPIGMIPCFLAALSRRLRARSRAASSSKCTWLKRASALRTCAASWMGRRRFPCESMYAKALSGSCARSFAPSFAMGGMIARPLSHHYRHGRWGGCVAGSRRPDRAGGGRRGGVALACPSPGPGGESGWRGPARRRRAGRDPAGTGRGPEARCPPGRGARLHRGGRVGALAARARSHARGACLARGARGDRAEGGGPRAGAARGRRPGARAARPLVAGARRRGRAGGGGGGPAGPVGHVQPDGTVRVAVAANQAETELLQGVLQEAGIPSNWRRTGGDIPDLLAAGYREIYVPAAAAEEAQALLATLETPDSEEDVAPTRRIGLERTGLRLFGKATVLLFVASAVVGIALGVVTDEPTLGLVALVAIVVAGAAVLVWSEQAGRG